MTDFNALSVKALIEEEQFDCRLSRVSLVSYR